jgi:hypothetical protein
VPHDLEEELGREMRQRRCPVHSDATIANRRGREGDGGLAGETTKRIRKSEAFRGLLRTGTPFSGGALSGGGAEDSQGVGGAESGMGGVGHRAVM